MGRFLQRCLWKPTALNWWIASLFAIGSTLFALGKADVNRLLFAGLLPFTTQRQHLRCPGHDLSWIGQDPAL